MPEVPATAAPIVENTPAVEAVTEPEAVTAEALPVAADDAALAPVAGVDVVAAVETLESPREGTPTIVDVAESPAPAEVSVATSEAENAMPVATAPAEITPPLVAPSGLQPEPVGDSPPATPAVSGTLEVAAPTPVPLGVPAVDDLGHIAAEPEGTPAAVEITEVTPAGAANGEGSPVPDAPEVSTPPVPEQPAEVADANREAPASAGTAPADTDAAATPADVGTTDGTAETSGVVSTDAADVPPPVAEVVPEPEAPVDLPVAAQPVDEPVGEPAAEVPADPAVGGFGDESSEGAGSVDATERPPAPADVPGEPVLLADDSHLTETQAQEVTDASRSDSQVIETPAEAIPVEEPVKQDAEALPVAEVTMPSPPVVSADAPPIILEGVAAVPETPVETPAEQEPSPLTAVACSLAADHGLEVESWRVALAFAAKCLCGEGDTQEKFYRVHTAALQETAQAREDMDRACRRATNEAFPDFPNNERVAIAQHLRDVLKEMADMADSEVASAAIAEALT